MKVIGIAGKARAGKDTVADYLLRNTKDGFGLYSFAQPIREATKHILMLSEEFLQHNKETTLPWVDTSYRDFAQKLGTDMVRDMIDNDFWVKRAQNVVNTCGYSALVIPDVRFENEAEWIRSIGGEIWHIERPDNKAVKEHISEAGILKQRGEYIINNNGTIEHLHRQLELHLTGEIK